MNKIIIKLKLILKIILYKMGKLNEVQEEVTQSYGNNAFTTKITNEAVEFDSARDQFKFLDPVDVPELTINGEPVVPGGGGLQPDERGNYNMGNDNNTFGNDSANNVVVGAPSAPEVANSVNGTNSLVVGVKNTVTSDAGGSVTIGYNNTVSGIRSLVTGEGNNAQSISGAAIASSSTTVTANGQYSAAVGCTNTTVDNANTVALGVRNETCGRANTVYVQNLYNITGREIHRDFNDVGVEYVSRKIIVLDKDAYDASSVSLAFPSNSNTSLVIKLSYKLKGGVVVGSLSGSVKQDNNVLESLTCDGEWHDIIIEPTVKNRQVLFVVEDGVQGAGDTFSIICEVYGTNL